MTPPHEPQTTQEFIDELAKVNKQLEMQTERLRVQADERHRINGQMTQFFIRHGLTMESLGDGLRAGNEAAIALVGHLDRMGNELKLLTEKVGSQSDRLKVHEFILQGVDGTNGIRSDVTYIKKRQQWMEIRMATISVALGSVGSGIFFLVKNLIQ